MMQNFYRINSSILTHICIIFLLFYYHSRERYMHFAIVARACLVCCFFFPFWMHKDFCVYFILCECMGNWHKGKSCGFVRQSKEIKWRYVHTGAFMLICQGCVAIDSARFLFIGFPVFQKRRKTFLFRFRSWVLFDFPTYSWSNFGEKSHPMRTMYFIIRITAWIIFDSFF